MDYDTMTEKIKILALALLLAAGLMLASFAAGWSLRGHQQKPISNDTITIMKVDTVTLVGPRDTLVRIAWKPYPVAVHDTTWITRHTTDSIFISLPYQYRHLSKPDTLDVWYSGVDPRIDSAVVYMRHTTEIIKQPYEVARMPRVTLDVGCGAFYAENNVNPYLLGEMRYNAQKTSWQVYGAVNYEGRWGVGAGVSYRFNIIR